MMPLFWRRRYIFRRFLQCCGIATIILTIFITLEYSRPTTFSPPAAERKIKYVLFWTPFFDVEDYNFGFGREPFINHSCPVNECYTTNNRSLMNLSDFDAFVFNSQSFIEVPESKYPHQKYVFLTMESVQYDYFPFNVYPKLFDITMTYRHDSDVVLSYGNVHKRTSSLNNAQMTKVPTKTKLCAWFATNCETVSKREVIVEELSNYIDVDIYGLCGSKTCPQWDEKLCDEMLRDYKFYLAFENSLCPDYVTEKIYRALKYDVIPVVYGGANYSKFAPPHSYIDVRNFTSVETLGKYLMLLSEDDVLYNEYFEWKRDYYVDDNRKGVHPFCKLCELLHSPDKTKASSADVKHWWLEENKCENADDAIQKLANSENDEW